MKILFIIIVLTLTCSCDTSKFKETPESKFFGLWKINDGTLYNGSIIKFSKDDNGEMFGRIVRLNNNKLLNLFVDSSNVIFFSFSRTSNFQFKISKMRVGSDLMKMYDVPTSDVLTVQFINDSTIGLANNDKDPLKSKQTLTRLD